MERREAFYLQELLPKGSPRAAKVALIRAANRLEEVGKVGIDRYYAGRHGKPGALIVRRPDVEVTASYSGRLRYAPTLSVDGTQNCVSSTLTAPADAEAQT